MKYATAVFFRFLAILAVIFCGITAAIPQSTEKDDEKVYPVWSDVNTETDKDIMYVYEKGVITGGLDGEFGTAKPFMVSEAAYAAVRLYEDKKDKQFSFNYYNAEHTEKYIKKATKYKIWNDALPKTDAPITREQFAAVLSPIVKAEKVLNKAKALLNEERFTFKEEVLAVYNRGIMLDTNVSDSFAADAELTKNDAIKLIMMCYEPDRRVKVKSPDYQVLEKTLTDKMAAWQGDWSLYFEDCVSGNKISINSHQVYSASLIKLFVAQAAYQKMAEGNLTINAKTEDEIRKMITYSDNDAWKYVAKRIGGSYSKGMKQVTQIAQASGFADTGQFYQGSHKNYNFTSVNDCGTYLRMLLDGKIVNEPSSEKILSLLKQQQHTQKIPAGVPESVETANKTGELDYMQGDAAIVYAPNGTYILVIIGDSLDNSYGQIDKFVDLSKTVYEYLN